MTSGLETTEAQGREQLSQFLCSHAQLRVKRALLVASLTPNYTA